MTLFTYIDELALKLISVVTKSESKKKALHQFFKFGVIGVGNTAIDFIIYIVLTRLFGSNIYIATTVSFIAGATFSFYANRTWTFNAQHKAELGEAAKFYLAMISGYLVNILVLYICVRYFGIHDLVGKVIATLVAVFWNFFVSKFWVFRKNS